MATDNIIKRPEKIFVYFTLFLNKIIKISFLKEYNHKNLFFEIGIVYHEISIPSKMETDFLSGQIENFNIYINNISLYKEMDNKELFNIFYKEPEKFSDYILLVDKEENIPFILDKFVSDNTIFYTFNTNVKILTDFFNFLKPLNKKIYHTDLINKISLLHVNNTKSIKAKLLLLKENA